LGLTKPQSRLRHAEKSALARVLSHGLTVASAPAEVSVAPSGLNETLRTSSLFASRLKRIASSSESSASATAALASARDDATRFWRFAWSVCRVANAAAPTGRNEENCEPGCERAEPPRPPSGLFELVLRDGPAAVGEVPLEVV